MTQSAMKKECESRTDFESLRKMVDNEIDYSDIPPLDDEMLNKGFAKLPRREPSSV
jgi:hypothetical protein